MHTKNEKQKKTKNTRKNIKQTKKRTNEQTIKPIQYEDIMETLFLLVNQFISISHKRKQAYVYVCNVAQKQTTYMPTSTYIM